MQQGSMPRPHACAGPPMEPGDAPDINNNTVAGPPAGGNAVKRGRLR